MSRKGENIYKRKDGRWEGRFIRSYQPNGKAKYGYVYAYTYREVKEKLNFAVMSKENSSDKDTASIAFSAIADQWLNGQKSRVKESTYNKYRYVLCSYILPYLGSTYVEEISCDTLINLRDELLKSGGRHETGLSSKTVSDTMAIVRSIMDFSTQKGYPYSFDPRAIRVKTPVSELRILSKQEQHVLYTYLHQNRSSYDIGILICFLTGMRIGEVCALCWEDISFSDHTIYVHKTMQRLQDHNSTKNKTKVTITSPKSVSSKRIIPIPKNLEDILKEFSTGKTGFVLSTDNSNYTEPRVLQYYFKKILTKLKIQHVNFHVLRHTFATRCIEVGFDVKSLSEILGHSNINITMNRYVHPSMDLKHENMQRLSLLFAVK